MFKIKKICVIGTGPSGLCAIKHSIDSNFEVIAFDKQDSLGGAWIYTDEIGIDKNGVEVHSSMYQNLITNLPKEIMQFPNFPHQNQDHSFVTSDVILNYLNLYADHYDLRNYINFGHEVTRVRPLPDKSWEVLVKNCHLKTYKTYIFDGIFVCNGFSVPKIPQIPGQDIFKGKQFHSHDYRNGKIFKDEEVVVIGSGPSGIELVLEIGKYAKKVYWSDHSIKTYGRELNITLPSNTIKKPDITEIEIDSITFEDGTMEKVTMITYATGYDFKFPFLSVDCGLSTNEKNIRPLYKHIFNVNYPTMAFCGIPFFALGFPLFDLQVRCILKFWRGEESLPSLEEMLESVQIDENERKKLGLPTRKFHLLGPHRHIGYYKDLAEISNVTPIPPVLINIFNEIIKLIFANFNTYRNYDFTIIDDEQFSVNLREK